MYVGHSIAGHLYSLAFSHLSSTALLLTSVISFPAFLNGPNTKLVTFACPLVLFLPSPSETVHIEQSSCTRRPTSPYVSGALDQDG
jgi:hypothetical protein